MTVADERFYPVFEQQPSDTYVEGWRSYTAETGEPETYDNVSNTKPDQLDNIVLLSEEIDVPTKLRPGGEMIPCPFCSANAPKFKRGRMAWFPDEKAVRFIGPKCAKTHFGDSYVTADVLYRRQQKCRDYIGLWADVGANRASIEEVFGQFKSIATDLQFVRDKLDADAAGFAVFLHRELAQAKGDLKVTEDLGMKDKNGNVVLQERVIGTVAGLRFLSDEFSTEPIVRRFETALANTSQPMPEWQPESPEHPATAEVLRLGSALERAFHALFGLREDLEDGRKFLEAKNLRLIEQWGRAPLSSPFVTFECRRAGNKLLIRSKSFAGEHYSNALIPNAIETAVLPAAPSLRSAA